MGETSEGDGTADETTSATRRRARPGLAPMAIGVLVHVVDPCRPFPPPHRLFRCRLRLACQGQAAGAPTANECETCRLRRVADDRAKNFLLMPASTLWVAAMCSSGNAYFRSPGQFRGRFSLAPQSHTTRTLARGFNLGQVRPPLRTGCSVPRSGWGQRYMVSPHRREGFRLINFFDLADGTAQTERLFALVGRRMTWGLPGWYLI